MSHLYKQERKHPTPLRRRLSRTQALLGRVIPGRLGVGVGDENAGLCGVVRPLRIPLVIYLLRCTYVVIVRWTDEMLCGGYKWMFRFEAPCFRTRWTGERWVEQMSRLHGTACQRQCGFIAMKLGNLDACEDWKVVRWCRTQASSHNSQGVVNGEVNEAGMSTAAPNRRAVLCGWNAPGLGWLFAELLLQHSSWSQQAASGARRVMPTSCHVTQGVGDTWATCPTLLRGIWDRSRRAGFRCCIWFLSHV